MISRECLLNQVDAGTRMSDLITNVLSFTIQVLT